MDIKISIMEDNDLLTIDVAQQSFAKQENFYDDFFLS